MSRARKSLPINRPRQSVVAQWDDPTSEVIRSVRADVQLLLEISKRKKSLETTRPRTASVTPTLNLVLARARDTARALTAQLQNNTGENTQIRMYVVSILIRSLLMSHLLCRLFATIVETASNLEKATGVSEGNAKHKPLPLETSLWILKSLLPFVRTVIQAKHTLLHPIHRLPVELLTDIFLHAHESNVDSTNGLLVRRLKPGNMMLPSSTVFILGRVSSYWRKIAQSTPALLSSVTVTNNRLPPWWKKFLTSGGINRRGIDLLIYLYNTHTQLNNTMNDIKMTWVRNLTIHGYDLAAFGRFLERGPLSRLEELNFIPLDASSERLSVPLGLSGTLQTLIVYECMPMFHGVFPKLRKLCIAYTVYKYPRDPHRRPDWGRLATFAPNLEELSVLHRSTFPEISALRTTAKDVELDWPTIRSLASLSPGLVKIPAERMRVRVEDVVLYPGKSAGRWTNSHSDNGSSLMEVLWNSFFTTTGLGQMVQKLTICGYPYSGTLSNNPLEPFTSLRILELEGNMAGTLMNSLSTGGSGKTVAPDTQDEARNEGTQEIAAACPKLERLVVLNSDLDGDALMRIINERNHSVCVLKGKVRLLKHVEIWNCPGVSAEIGRSLRLLRDQDV